MSKFSDKFVDGMSLVAEKVDENKFLGAIKDSFTIYMPFVIVGSFMNLFNTILCSTTTGLAKWVPALEALKPIFTAANFATLSCMTLPIVFLIGLKLGKKNNVPEHISAIMALASYLTICPQIVSVVADDKTGTASGLPGAALGSQGLFVGMLVAILASQLFAFLMTFDKLKIKMPASVPTAITTSFNALIPIVLTLLGVSVGGYAFRQISGQYLTDWIYTTIQHPLENAFQSPAGLFIIILVCRAFWFLGIHGDLIIKPVRDPFLAAALAANVASSIRSMVSSSSVLRSDCPIVAFSSIIAKLTFLVFRSARNVHRVPIDTHSFYNDSTSCCILQAANAIFCRQIYGQNMPCPVQKRHPQHMDGCGCLRFTDF